MLGVFSSSKFSKLLRNDQLWSSWFTRFEIDNYSDYSMFQLSKVNVGIVLIRWHSRTRYRTCPALLQLSFFQKLFLTHKNLIITLQMQSYKIRIFCRNDYYIYFDVLLRWIFSSFFPFFAVNFYFIGHILPEVTDEVFSSKSLRQLKHFPLPFWLILNTTFWSLSNCVSSFLLPLPGSLFCL